MMTADENNESNLMQKIIKLETYMDMVLKDRDKIQENSDNQIAMSKDISQIKTEQAKISESQDEFKEARIKIENQYNYNREHFERVEKNIGRIWKSIRGIRSELKLEITKVNAWKTLIMNDFPAMRDDYKDLKKLLLRFVVAILLVGALSALGVSLGIQYLLPF